HEFVFACLARGLDGRKNAATGAGDFLVACAVEPHLEFAGTIASENQMRMTVDQARRDPAAVAIDLRRRIETGRFACWPGKRNLRISGRNDALVDHAQAG